MQTLQTKSRHTIELYDGIDEMPMERYHRYNQLLVLNSGVGTDVSEIVGKLKGIMRLLNSDRVADAKVELSNLNMAYAVFGQGLDIKSRAMAATVKSIDGEACDDVTDAGLARTAERLNKILTKGERDGALAAVKKKIDEELRYFFPDIFGETEQLVLVKNMLVAVLDGIIEDRDTSEQVKKIQKKVEGMTGVTNMQGYERDSDLAFEQGCLCIRETLHGDAKKMSVKEYYAARKMLEERAKEYERISNRHSS